MEKAMTDNKKRLIFTLILVVLLGIVLIFTCVYFFSRSPEFKALFSGTESQSAAGTVGPEAEDILQQRMEFTGKVSMWIFIFITLLQMAAMWVGYAVISTIKYSTDPVKLKLRNLDNAEVFFDVPLYFGLFGTVSAFLVMTFSPQSSRLIAYSSTLIGIIFSLLLRLTLQYPLRKELVRCDAMEEISEENK
jgi:predicted permease